MPEDRLPPLRRISLYGTIATKLVRAARSDSPARPGFQFDAMGVAIGAIRNAQDAIAVLQEHTHEKEAS